MCVLEETNHTGVLVQTLNRDWTRTECFQQKPLRWRKGHGARDVCRLRLEHDSADSRKLGGTPGFGSPQVKGCMLSHSCRVVAVVPRGEQHELSRLQELSSEKAASCPRAECPDVTMTGRRHQGGMEVVLR